MREIENDIDEIIKRPETKPNLKGKQINIYKEIQKLNYKY